MVEWQIWNDGQCARANVGQVLRLYVTWQPVGDTVEYTAEVQDGAGNLIERQDGIHFAMIARDIAVAMAHRLLRDTVLMLEGVSVE